MGKTRQPSDWLLSEEEVEASSAKRVGQEDLEVAPVSSIMAHPLWQVVPVSLGKAHPEVARNRVARGTLPQEQVVVALAKVAKAPTMP